MAIDSAFRMYFRAIQSRRRRASSHQRSVGGRRKRTRGSLTKLQRDFETFYREPQDSTGPLVTTWLFVTPEVVTFIHIDQAQFSPAPQSPQFRSGGMTGAYALATREAPTARMFPITGFPL